MSPAAIMAGTLADMSLVSGMEKLGRGFKGQATDSNIPAVLLAVLALGVFVIMLDLVYGAWQRRPRARRVDYLDCGTRLLGLSFRERHDLKTLARRARLPHPAAMLMSPANLAYAVEQATQTRNSRALRRRANSLSKRLFGVALPGVPTG